MGERKGREGEGNYFLTWEIGATALGVALRVATPLASGWGVSPGVVPSLVLEKRMNWTDKGAQSTRAYTWEEDLNLSLRLTKTLHQITHSTLSRGREKQRKTNNKLQTTTPTQPQQRRKPTTTPSLKAR